MDDLPFFLCIPTNRNAATGHISQLPDGINQIARLLQGDHPCLIGVMLTAAEELPHAIFHIMGNAQNRRTVQHMTAGKRRRIQPLPEGKTPAKQAPHAAPSSLSTFRRISRVLP